MRIALALCLALLPQALPAQPQVSFSAEASETCLAEGGAAETCIGRAANACMKATPGGETTAGMGGCLEAEWLYWDARLNAAYGRALEAARAMDAEAMAGAPNQAEALRAMQRLWIPYRDGQCAYVASLWAGGTGAGPASLHCLMDLTGRQALFLEASAEGF